MRILQIALITQKGNVFNVKMQIDEIVFESKEEVREKLLSVFANRQDAVVDVVIHSIQDELELSDYSNEQLKAELKRRSNIARVNYPQAKDLWALDVERSSCIGHDSNSHLSWVFTYPHVAMLRAALTSASATLPQCAQRKCLPFLMPM